MSVKSDMKQTNKNKKKNETRKLKYFQQNEKEIAQKKIKKNHLTSSHQRY